jgi:SOS-response transcriptional repressor LexA
MTTERPLTPGQYQCWIDIAEYINEHDIAPSVTDLMESANALSRSTTQSRLAKLRERGLIHTEPHRPRSISLVVWPPEVPPRPRQVAQAPRA